MLDKLKDVLQGVEMECGLGIVEKEILILLDEFKILEFNKMDCPFWFEVQELYNQFNRGINYQVLVNSFLEAK